jgi:hypothetical protein
MPSLRDSNERFFQLVFETTRPSAALPIRERLAILEMAWLMLATQERCHALATPGGFPEAQAQQLERLDSMATLVRTDTPDLEAERLFHEDDLDGMMEHFRRRITGDGGE